MSRATRSKSPSGRHGGAIIITFSMMLLFLIGFAAIATDLGRLFIVRSELQTALDSCALAAAQELDGQGTAIDRARNAGTAAGNLNNVNLQSSTWDGQTKITKDEITFRDASYAATVDGASARYAQCQHTQPGVKTWLLSAMGAFVGTNFASTNAVLATAVATRTNAQNACPVPVAIRARTNTPPNYGFLIGEWITVNGKKLGAGPGEMGWYNLNGSTNAKDTGIELGEPGMCGVKIGDSLTTPGTQASVDDVWNQRFGIYKNNDGPSQHHPDLTGYAYTPLNWNTKVPQNAYDGPAPSKPVLNAENFITKRAKFASFDDTGTNVNDASGKLFPNPGLAGGYKNLATPGVNGEHATYGYNRRLVIVPVLTDTNSVTNFACMLMLAPLVTSGADGQMEFRGNASAVGSPCTTNGIAGGSAGPLVPVLVR